tara:strand:- start:318 stop:545 length:228 start_codon:yes stop_codon:yes gene_type:complete
MIKDINVGDLVRFIKRKPSAQVSAAGIAAQERYLREKMPYMLEIGIVVENDCVRGCVVSFPSRVGPVATLNLEIL